MRFEEAMDEVLETSRYDFLTGRRVDIRERIYDLMESFLEWLFENLGIDLPEPASGGAGLIAVLFIIIAVVLVSVAVIVLIRAYLQTRAPKRHTLADMFEELRNHTVAELLELSSASKNRRVAIRYKYIAVILWLNENDIIVIEPSATNAIILRQIKNAAPHLAAPFSQITDAFHLTWFGHKDLNDEKFLKFDSAVNTVMKDE